MTKYIDLSGYWNESMTISEAQRQTKLDKRTLSTAKRGVLDRCQIDTLIKLKELAEVMSGRAVTIEEMIVDR